MARYGQSFKDRAVALLLPPESASLELVSKEVGIASGTLQCWREEVQSMPAQAIYPAELDQWYASATTALAEP